MIFILLRMGPSLCGAAALPRLPISKPLWLGLHFLMKMQALKQPRIKKQIKTPQTPLKRGALASYRISHPSGLSALSGSSRLRSVRHSEVHSSRSAPPPPRFRFQARFPGFFVFFPPLFDYISRANEYKAKPFGRALNAFSKTFFIARAKAR